jgi:purine-nucleoside phosphorylase
MIQEIKESADYLRRQGIDAPEIGVILGTGLGNSFVSRMQVEVEVPYENIPYFPEATVEFHHGKLLYGVMSGKKVLAMQGRYHYYEGYSMQQVTLPVRVMKVLGINRLLISNAAGNLNTSEWSKGDLMLLEDHINLLPENPLRGPNLDEFGPRYPDMSRPYDSAMNSLAEEIARTKGVTLRKGVYAAVEGPNLETRAEYRYLKVIGADAVGMSTIPEAIVANHMGLPCLAISVLTDDCDPDNLAVANIQEIIKIAGQAEIPLTNLFSSLIEKI